MIRPLLLAALVAGLAGAGMTMTTAQQERNQALWTAARSCENGSLSVVRMSNQGVPFTQTMNSSGNEFAPFQKCYGEKAAPRARPARSA
jgi:ABC-type sugar transport system substrate-binding protein